MKRNNATAVAKVAVAALTIVGCAADADDFVADDVVAAEDAGEDRADRPDAETVLEVTPPSDDAAGPDADTDADTDDDAGETAPVRTAQWICLGDNPDRIGGCRNGSEVCDDDAFRVTDDLLGPLVLACFAGDQGDGIAFVATNTGPQCELPTCSGLVNDRPRCQGWEKCECENAWDPGNTQYASDGGGPILILDCPPEGATRDVDLSAYVGQNMWVGVHTQQDGVGRMTEVCVSKKTW